VRGPESAAKLAHKRKVGRRILRNCEKILEIVATQLPHSEVDFEQPRSALSWLEAPVRRMQEQLHVTS
jgi:hypothetical protein